MDEVQGCGQHLQTRLHLAVEGVGLGEQRQYPYHARYLPAGLDERQTLPHLRQALRRVALRRQGAARDQHGVSLEEPEALSRGERTDGLRAVLRRSPVAAQQV